MDNAQNLLWNQVFDYILKYCSTSTRVIFVHNLGAFDGYFIYKALSKIVSPDKVSAIIDDKNKFIQISWNIGVNENIINFKDSYRIFPVSLAELCNIFGVVGKISKYNQLWNDIKVLDNNAMLQEFIEYSLQDSRSLWEALRLAQQQYFTDFKVDITSIYSTSTLSLKIFRVHFMKTIEDSIMVLKPRLDNFIRKGY